MMIHLTLINQKNTKTESNFIKGFLKTKRRFLPKHSNRSKNEVFVWNNETDVLNCVFLCIEDWTALHAVVQIETNWKNEAKMESNSSQFSRFHTHTQRNGRCIISGIRSNKWILKEVVQNKGSALAILWIQVKTNNNKTDTYITVSTGVKEYKMKKIASTSVHVIHSVVDVLVDILFLLNKNISHTNQTDHKAKWTKEN